MRGEVPRKSRTELPLVQLIPNMMTLGAIAAGMTAIRFAESGRFRTAIALIIIAAAIDGIDGRIARMLKSESALGAELDSLADFLNFGIAPAMILFHWGPEVTQG
ncbi:MAG: CDP-alcohol phosphatidyltransferase family protein, partial [Deltaproteobacteria bacterium]